MKNIYKIILTGLILGTMLVNSSCSLKGLNNDVETTSTPLPTSTDLNIKLKQIILYRKMTPIICQY